jgi:hypothetical protein
MLGTLRGLSLLDQALDNNIEVRVACAEAPGKPVPSALRDFLTFRNHLELASLARLEDSFNSQSILDHGRETRGLGAIALSCGAVNDFDPHIGFKPNTL